MSLGLSAKLEAVEIFYKYLCQSVREKGICVQKFWYEGDIQWVVEWLMGEA